MDFTFTEEQEMIKNMVRDFGQKELAPGYAERVKTETVPPELIKKMAALGLLGLNVPEEYGGEVKDTVTAGIILEELARHADDGAWLAFNGFAMAEFLKLGKDEIKDEWLTGMAKGEKLVLMGATEAEAGSDLDNGVIGRKVGGIENLLQNGIIDEEMLTQFLFSPDTVLAQQLFSRRQQRGRIGFTHNT